MITRWGKSMVKVSSQSQEKLKLEIEEEPVRKYQKHKHHIKTRETVPLQGETKVGYPLSLLLLEVLA